MACAICEVRRPRRFCPGTRGDICTVCCGTEREVTVNCPLDCEFLLEARHHERTAPLDHTQVPNLDIPVTDSFLHEHEELLMFVSRGLVSAALDIPGVVDSDVREALDGLIRTYRTLQSGVLYESRPTNPLAGGIYAAVAGSIDEYRRAETASTGMSKTRDAEVLGVLAFLQRLEYDRNNGRRRGRAFISMLLGFQAGPETEQEPDSPSLLLP